MHPSADSTNPHNDNVYALWDRLAEFSAGDGDAALIRLLSMLCAMAGAQNAFWAVVVRLPSPAPKDALFAKMRRLVGSAGRSEACETASDGHDMVLIPDPTG